MHYLTKSKLVYSCIGAYGSAVLRFLNHTTIPMTATATRTNATAPMDIPTINATFTGFSVGLPVGLLVVVCDDNQLNKSEKLLELLSDFLGISKRGYNSST
jgi:ABC-type methionine transport system permease subunit